MKVLFIAADNVYLTPYLKYYIDIINKLSIKYDVLYWDKNSNERIADTKYVRFCIDGNSKFKKIIGYYKFKKKIISMCKLEKYDVIIPLHPIVSFIICRMLITKYNGKYIYDVRDYSYEKYALYRKCEKKLTENSLINVISSEGFKNFLPKANYHIIHNIINIECDKYKQLENSKEQVINISYIGLIRFMDKNKEIINFFKNDKRFHLNFIGTNAEQLKEFCDKVGTENVTLIGTFDSADTLEYYKKSDLIMNLYGNNTPLLDYALSNKLYYSALLYKPILVCPRTYMEKMTKTYSLGFTLEMRSKSELDKLYDYITKLERKDFKKNCDYFIENVLKENEKTKKQIEESLSLLENK